MGQQQLLLLVLGIVIVGIAILVGINAYSENSVKSNWDSLLQDGLRIASDAQSWKTKPELFGGSPDATKPDSNDYVTLDFIELAYSPSMIGVGSAGPNTCYSNLNGVYDMDEVTVDGLVITGRNVSTRNQVTINVEGTLEASISLDEDRSWKGGVNITSGTETPADGLAACG